MMAAVLLMKLCPVVYTSKLPSAVTLQLQRWAERTMGGTNDLAES